MFAWMARSAANIPLSIQIPIFSRSAVFVLTSAFIESMLPRIYTNATANREGETVKAKMQKIVSPTRTPEEIAAALVKAHGEIVELPVPPELRTILERAGLKIAKGATIAEVAVLALTTRALTGDVAAFKEIRETVEGPDEPQG